MCKNLAIVSGILWLASSGAAIAHEPPTTGWTIHLDAKRHIAGDLNAVAHHYCKGGLPNGVMECQLYDSDAVNARLVGVEVIIGADAYASLPKAEKPLWHSHKTTPGKVGAVFPDMTEEEAAAFSKSIEETYGKIFLIWDYPRDELPIGQPEAYDIGDNAKR